MSFRQKNDAEDITEQFAIQSEETVPLTSREIKLEEFKEECTEWKDEVPPELEPYLQTVPTLGLTQDQVAERLERFGRNELPERKRNKLLHFLSFFTDAIACLMMISVVLTAVTQDWVDFGIILGMLIVNALIGYVEETRAESAVESLKKSLALHSRCRRLGQIKEVPASELVIGDILILRIGDIVPADARLLGIGANGEAIETDLRVDQSSLTGESMPIKKKKGDLVYSSCVIKHGQQLGVVVRTGPDTFIGRTASLMTVTAETGHFQRVINYIGWFLILASVVLVLIIFAFDLIEQKIQTGSVTGEHVLSALNEMVVLTIAAIPVGLPTVMSVTMAIGAKLLAKRQVIVKRLTAVEELASVSILCSDKTGTLTLNELSFDEPYVEPSFTKNDLLLYAYLASEIATNDPIEVTIRNAAQTAHPLIDNDGSNIVQGFSVKSFKPFDPTDKMSQATVYDQSYEQTFRVAKGAPQAIMGLLGEQKDMAPIDDIANDFATRGLRALAVARTAVGTTNGWQLVGLFSLIDPPRHDSAETIRDCAAYGLTVKMITGDQTVIAKEIARRLGMGDGILDANALVDGSRSDMEIKSDCLHSDGFARVIPEHKYRVVELLQQQGYFVAMTGDGVNDAPALKKANIGIAVEGSTDAARSAADVILMAPGLSSIIDAIKTSRIIFQRLHSYALYRITSTIHFLLFFFVVTLANDWKMPPVLLILISVLNDAATLIMSVDNMAPSMSPKIWRLRLLIVLSCVLAIVLSGFSFAHFYIFKDLFQVTPGQLSSIMYLHISSAPHFVIFSTRTELFCWQDLPSWPFTIVVLGTQVIALILSVYGLFGLESSISGIGWTRGIAILAISLGTAIIIDFVKVGTIRLWNRMFGENSIRKRHSPFKPKSRAQRFQKEQLSRAGYDRAKRRESTSSVHSF